MATPIETVRLPAKDLKNIKDKLPNTWNIVKVGFGKDNENQVVENEAVDACCAVKYPAGSINPTAKDRPVGGLGFYACPMPIFPASDVEMNYKLQFDATFDPACGGKLPGLFLSEAGAKDTSAGSGGRMSDLHGSARLMWRADFQAEAYVYATAARNNPNYEKIPKGHFNPEYGDSLWRGMLMFKKAPAWNTIKIRVRLNTPGQNNGALYVTVNGVDVSFEEMCWRKNAKVVISAVMFSTFYGGSSEKFKCPCDTKARFKDFELKKFAGVGETPAKTKTCFCF